MNKKLLFLTIAIAAIALIGCNTIIHITSRSDPKRLDTNVGGRINKPYDFEKVSGLDVPDDIEMKLVRAHFYGHVALSVDSGAVDSLRPSIIYVFLSKTDSTDVPLDTNTAVPPTNPVYNRDNHRLIITIDFAPLSPLGDSADFTINAELNRDDLIWADEIFKSDNDFYVKAVLIPPITNVNVQTDVTAWVDDAYFEVDFEKETGGLFPLLFWF
ncbi:hypothetical protein JXA84_00695 [candidate division WOR-3 bacterium]|nr:hypothetical protein [candidate division WOR-3 bacterium]